MIIVIGIMCLIFVNCYCPLVPWAECQSLTVKVKIQFRTHKLLAENKFFRESPVIFWCTKELLSKQSGRRVIMFESNVTFWRIWNGAWTSRNILHHLKRKSHQIALLDQRNNFGFVSFKTFKQAWFICDFSISSCPKRFFTSLSIFARLFGHFKLGTK